jgi:hypothetical protein
MAEPDHFHTFVLIGLQEKADKWVKSWYKCRNCPIWEYRKAAYGTCVVIKVKYVEQNCACNTNHLPGFCSLTPKKRKD